MTAYQGKSQLNKVNDNNQDEVYQGKWQLNKVRHLTKGEWQLNKVEDSLPR